MALARLTKTQSALLNRLEADTLNDRDKEQMGLAKELRALRKIGISIKMCALKLERKEDALEQFMSRGPYKLFCQYFEGLERGTDEEAAAKIVRKAKHEFAGFAPDAIEYVRSCYERNAPEDQAEKGIWKDDAKAMWATEKVAKGLGLTEPDTALRPVININIAHIRAEQALVGADDAEAEAAAKAIDVTPTTP